ncbi:hypothetical protein [Salipiger sp. PrR002]|uniref:hypothetical protein n=1 Tax=Salipiger sp. PrR002 TaxID=2706489 RepID=UPI0013BC6E05|nr:hypothetical protein [Salipiger sp. PrR002]NDW00058.1 hypothetical protein [Salipiger sp. PrR002]NDW56933.1 hypothetical protein [Salipiger sp. PrR004]
MSLPDPMTPEQVQALARSLSRIGEIDTSINKLGKLLSDSPVLPDELGSKLRAIVGARVMPHFTDERLGQVILAAVINALLHERGLIEAVAKGFALVPDAPCPRQELEAIWETHECGTTNL